MYFKSIKMDKVPIESSAKLEYLIKYLYENYHHMNRNFYKLIKKTINSLIMELEEANKNFKEKIKDKKLYIDEIISEKERLMKLYETILFMLMLYDLLFADNLEIKESLLKKKIEIENKVSPTLELIKENLEKLLNNNYSIEKMLRELHEGAKYVKNKELINYPKLKEITRNVVNQFKENNINVNKSEETKEITKIIETLHEFNEELRKPVKEPEPRLTPSGPTLRGPSL